MNAEKVTRITSIVSTLLVLALAIGGFTLSYAALHDVAMVYGVPSGLAWIWPLLVDGAIVVFALAVVRASLLKEPTGWLWAMVGLFTTATIVFNVLHSGSGIVSIVVAIVAPIALVLSFETLMAMVKSQVERAGLVQSLRQIISQIGQKELELDRLIEDKRLELDNLVLGRRAAVDNLQVEAGKLADENETARGKLASYQQDIEARREELKRLDGGQLRVYLPDNLTVEQRQSIVAKMDNDRLTIGQMAEALGVSEGTIKNDKRAIKEPMNGKH